jgi:outer membrane protein OmpA-like peptidoglycan-associated protein
MDREDEKKVDQLAYLTNQRVEVAKQTIALRTAEGEAEESPRRAPAKLDARDAQIAKLQDSLNAKQTDRGTLVTFGDVLFDFNKAELKSNAYPNITKLAQFLQENPERKVIVEGYTDSVGSANYNQTCPSAAPVRAHGTGTCRRGPCAHRVPGLWQGVPGGRQRQQLGRAQNRRVEVTISNDNQPVAPRSVSQVGSKAGQLK